MDRVERDDSQLVVISDERIKQWVGFGHLMLAIYLERYAAFEE